MTIISTTGGQESFRRNAVALIINKAVQNAVLGCNLKNDTMILVCFQGKPFNITVIQVCAPITNAEEVEVELFYEYLQDLLELKPKKRCPFHHRRLECKSKKSWDTWSNRQVWPWSTIWTRAKANRRMQMSKECTEEKKKNALVIANALFQQHKRWLNHVNYQMVNTEIRLIIFFAAKDKEVLYSQQKQDQELTVIQIMNTLLQNADLNWRK